MGRIEEIRALEPRLFDYQVEDVASKMRHKYILNANRMGYGKTVEALMFAKLWQCKSVLIVCPKTVVAQWVKEIKNWLGIDAHTLEPKPKKGTWVVVNYDFLSYGCKQDYLAPRTRNYKAFTWDLIICDEAHRIKNMKSIRSKVMHQLPSDRRIAQTGTPITNTPQDLYSLLKWLHPSYTQGSYWQFVNRYCEIEITPFCKKIKGLTKDRFRQQELINILEGFTIRNPDLVLGEGKLRHPVELPMSTKQRKLYKQIQQLIIDELPKDCTIFNGMMRTLRLRQMTSNPQLFDESITNPKFEWIKELLIDNPNLRVVIFSAFEKSVLELRTTLTEGVIYTGSMQAQDREQSKFDFISGKERVLIGTIGALGEGVDGLQYNCNTMIFLDRDWSPSVNEQAEDRLNRIGQKHRCDIYCLECEKSIDQYVGKVNLHKMKDIKEILG